ncbi:MAG: cbb3-type cytochrome oxidase assembly protein [Archangium sp.]|nr:cbb3-type cytochrome oxidase assembly protein [Archangium sp.]
MSVIVLQVFVSLMLVVGSVVLFVWTVRSRTLEHADRLSLAPLEDDVSPQPSAPTAQKEEP